MTEESKIKALAELDGWQRAPEFDYVIDPPSYAAGSTREMWGRDGVLKSDLPPYLTSYDAILPLIQKYSRVSGKIASDHWNQLSLTPSQLCETLLRATGKWVE